MLMVSGGVAICMFLVMQWSFDRGFLHYVNTLDQDKITALSTSFADEYQQDGSWGPLANNPRRWHELINSSDQELPTPADQNKPRENRKPPKFGFGPRSSEDFPPRFTQRNAPPRERYILPEKSNIQARSEHSKHRQPPNRRPPPPQQKRVRMILLTADKETIYGPPRGIEEFSLSPITLHNQTIGYLGIKPMKEISDAHDLIFVQEQSQTFLMIAIAMVAISMLLSIPIAGHLVKPIKRLAHGTQQLTSGNFETHIQVTSQDELGTLSDNFNTLATTLKGNEYARQQWIADISHELRTPIAVLKGEIEAIEDNIRKPTAENIASLGQEVNHLSHLVSDLYELSMSDIGALNYQKSFTDIIPILDHCIETFIDPFSCKKITLTFDAKNLQEATLLVDPQRIKQLINNLLKNSLRYTDNGGKSQLFIQKLDTEFQIHLQDSAPGVPTEEIPKLFERLYRVEASRNRSNGGAGLGLSICSNIVSAHDGNISAQPSPQGGLWVTVSLPIKKRSQNSA